MMASQYFFILLGKNNFKDFWLNTVRYYLKEKKLFCERNKKDLHKLKKKKKGNSSA